MEKFIEMLGYNYRDKVTKFEGVAESMSIDLYGCIQFGLRPPINKEGKLDEGRWFDVTRLERTGKRDSRVMELPVYDHLMRAAGVQTPAFNAPGSGPADKSTMRRG